MHLTKKSLSALPIDKYVEVRLPDSQAKRLWLSRIRGYAPQRKENLTSPYPPVGSLRAMHELRQFRGLGEALLADLTEALENDGIHLRKRKRGRPLKPLPLA